jgi:hypothetical protein
VTPFSFHLNLGDIAPGRYDCDIIELDPAGHCVAFRVNPVMLVQRIGNSSQRSAVSFQLLCDETR